MPTVAHLSDQAREVGAGRVPAERRLAISFGAALALLLCMALFFTVQASRFLASTHWVAHTHHVISEVEQVLFDVQAAESSQRGYSASGREAYLAPFDSALAGLPAHLNDLRASVADNPAQVSRCHRFQLRITEKLAIMRQRFEQRRTLGVAALDPQYMDGSGRRVMEALIADGREMIGVENGLLVARDKARIDGLHTAVALLLVASALTAGLLIAGFLLNRRELRHGRALGDAVADANRGLENEVSERRRAQQRLGVQHAIARAAEANVSLARAAPEFLRIICEHLDWDLGELWTAEPCAGVLRAAGVWHRPADSSASAGLAAEFAAVSRTWSFGPGEGLPGRVWSEAGSLWEHDLSSSGCFLRTAAAAAAGLRRAFAFRLQAAAAGETAGTMVFLSREPGRPDPELVETMNTLAGQIVQFSARCEAQAALQASEARFTAFMDNAPALAYIKDEEGRMVYGNRALLQHFGLTRQEWLGHTDYDLWPEAAPAFRAHDAQVFAEDRPTESKEHMARDDGGMTHWLSYKFPLREEGTGRRFLGGVSVDITARAEAETALRAEREFLAALLANLQASVMAFDAQGRLTHCNRVASLFNGFPADGPVPPRESWGDYFDLLPVGGGEAVRPGTGPLALALCDGEVTRDQDFIIRLKDGRERSISLSVTPLNDDQGRRLGAVVVAHDVTARGQAREVALQSLREKETLLQEVHHRVKNNLQIIGSLLAMQSRRTKSPVALAALAESASRVRSIALVHEKLYRAVDLEYVEAADYLRTLARNLMDALGAERLGLKGRVSLDFDLEAGHRLDASAAIACGLIVNEALTNSFKHGFPDGRSGRVTLALKGAPAPAAGADGHPAAACSRLRLEVRDDGVGLPAEALTPAGTAALSRDSLGLRLMRDLSKQVTGWLELAPADPEAGTGLSLRLEFPARAPSNLN